MVEVMVIAAILAVLVAVLIPILAGARRAAKQSRCVVNLSQIGKALHLYAGDHDDLVPPYLTHWAQTEQWKSAFLEYKVAEDQFYCPLDWRARNPEQEWPYVNDADPGRSSYATPMALERWRTGPEPFPFPFDLAIRLTMSEVEDPSTFGYAFDDWRGWWKRDEAATPILTTAHGMAYNKVCFDGRVKLEKFKPPP